MAINSTRASWRNLHVETELDGDIVHFTAVYCDTVSGKDFTVSVSGPGDSSAFLFIGALLAFQEQLSRQTGVLAAVTGYEKTPKPI